MRSPLILAIVLVFPYSAFAEGKIRTSTVVYASPLLYNNSTVKYEGNVSGAYGYLGYEEHSFEAGIEYTKIDFKSTSDFDQYDFTFVYSNDSIPSCKFRVGAHYIETGDKITNNAVVVFGGLNYYKPYKWNVGLDAYASRYNNYNPSSLTTYQITPKFGFSFLHRKAHSFYSETKGYYIKLQDEVGMQDKDFLSIEESLYYTYKNITFGGYGWVGKQTIAVRNDGFVVYNFSVEHKSGYGTSIEYSFRNKSGLKLNVKRELFDDFSSKKNASSTAFILSFGHTF